MKNKIFVSVLIPVYNVEKYVEKCILSVLNQTMQDKVEVIIVNDCTPDKSMDKIRELIQTHVNGRKIKIVIVNHDKNRGSAAARNTGLSHAKGDYIIHVDSDDYIEPDMIEKMYAEAIRTDADMIISDYYARFLHRKVLCREKYTEKDTYFGELIAGYHGSLWNKMIKRSLYEEHSVHALEGLDCGEDYIMMLPLMYYAQHIAYIPFGLYNYVKYNPDSITKKLTDKVKRNIFEQINYAKRFVAEHRLYKFEKNLAYLILSQKVRLLESSFPNERKQLLSLFPETDKYLSSYLKETSFQKRLLLKGHVSTSLFVKSTKDVIKKILRMN